MKNRVTSGLSRNESAVLRDLAMLLRQTPEEFVRTAINAAFDQLIEDGRLLASDSAERMAWIVYAREYRIRGGSMSVAEWIIGHGQV